MRRRIILLLGPFLLLGCAGERLFTIPDEVINSTRIEVSPGDNREFAYTNKESAFYYGYTNRYNDKYFQGWTVYNQKLFEEYIIEIDGNPLFRKRAQTDVYPHQLVRNYGDFTESLTLVDRLNLLLVDLTGNGSLVIYLLFPPKEDYQVRWDPEDSILFVTSGNWQKLAELPNLPRWLGICLSPNGSFSKLAEVPPFAEGEFLPGRLTLKLKGQAKLIFAADRTREAVRNLIEKARTSSGELIDAKKERLCRLLRDSWVFTEDEDLNRALEWAKISMDALIMNQDKKGIFAGLPWFNSYWGRDTFISLPGALLVTGGFEEAKEILRSFATYQLRDEADSLFGRIPNRVTVTDAIYNTADGTPWFVREAYEYILYSGDREFAKEIYPVVKRSIEGTIRYRIDPHGFLSHDDADTWMDAKIEGRIPWSARGDRACDIQALWFTQLVSWAMIAQLAGEDSALIEGWLGLARKVKRNFSRFFIDEKHHLIYDHLNRDGSQDLQYRPNQILCLTIPFREIFPPGSGHSPLNGPLGKIDLDEFARRLVYPQGVGSLWREEVNFHPYHLHPNYHFDASYHNGIIWTWNSGPAITAFLRANRTYVPYRLFKSTTDQILHKGAVGTISELIDVLPKPGMDSPELSGCFTQAWSLAEYLRNFYQDILGVYPLLQEYGFSLSPSSLIKYFGRTKFVIRTKFGKVFIKYDVGNKKIHLYSDELQESLPIVVEKRDYLLEPGKILTISIKEELIPEKGDPSKLAIPQIPEGTKSLQFKDYLERKLRKAERD